MNKIEVIAHGSPNSLARRIQEDPGYAIEILRKCKWVLGHSVPSGLTEEGGLKYRRLMNELYEDKLKEVSDEI